MKKAYSDKQLEYMIIKGNCICINFDEDIETRIDDDGKETIQYVYNTATVAKVDDRNTRIEKIIKTKYPTYGAEFAAMNNGGKETDDYINFRQQAKLIADDSLEFQYGVK